MITRNPEIYYSGTMFSLDMQIKSWIRTVPTHVSKKHIQSYFDEFTFRMNRLIFKVTIFHKTTQRMMREMPIYHNQITRKLNI